MTRKVWRFYQANGARSTLTTILLKSFWLPLEQARWKIFQHSTLFNPLRRLLEELKLHNQPVLVYPPFMSWNIPMFQRPQHFAIQLARLGQPFLYGSNHIYDGKFQLKQLEKNLYLFSITQYAWLSKSMSQGVFILHPNYQGFYSQALIEEWLSRGNQVVYDYLDDLDPVLFGPVNEKHGALHRWILHNEKIQVWCSAQKQLQDLQSCRRHNFYELPNACDPSHFQNPQPPEILPASLKSSYALITTHVQQGAPVLGYFGALAAWLDVELIQQLAQACPETYVWLIGQDLGGDQARLVSQCPNVICTGVIPYDFLPIFAQHFTVSMIPFRLNGITEATSPIKLFEYMALGKPIVTTGLPECRRYASAQVAETPEAFIQTIQEILKQGVSETYLRTLHQEASENTWEHRARTILKFLHLNAA